MPAPYPLEVRDRARELRRDPSLTLAQIAARVGVNVATVERWTAEDRRRRLGSEPQECAFRFCTDRFFVDPQAGSRKYCGERCARSERLQVAWDEAEAA